MVYAEQLFNGSDGGALGNLSGTWTWNAITLDPSGSGLLSTSQWVNGGSSARYADTCKTAHYYDWSNTYGAHYGRAYLYLTAAPQNGFILGKLFGNSWARQTAVIVSSGRRVGFRTGATGTDEASDYTGSGAEDFTLANVVPLNAWCRIEWFIHPTTQCEVRLYTSSIHGASADYVAAHTPTGYVGMNGMQFGPLSMTAAGTTRVFAPSGGYVYLDALRVDSASWVGPISVVSGGASLTSTVSLTSAATIPPTAAASLTSTADLSSSATLAYPVGASFTSTAGLSSSAVIPITSDAALTATGALSADAEVSEITTADAALAGVGALTSGAYLDSEIAPGYLFGSVAPNPVTGG